MKILLSGGSGLLAKHLVQTNREHEIIAPKHLKMDITKYNEVIRSITYYRPEIFLHCAAMTTPMENHDQYQGMSINTNIIGTANLAMACHHSRRTRLVYISTDYVYPGTKGLYKEDSPLSPINNYAKSKLGGEMAAQMLPDSLILRCAFTKRPFPHARAFTDYIKSYIYVDKIAPLILRLIESGHTGIVNVGGNHQTIYEFAKQSVPDVGKITRADIGDWVPADTSMDLSLMEKILND